MSLTQLINHGKLSEIEPYIRKRFPDTNDVVINILVCVIFYLRTLPEEFRTKGSLIVELNYLKLNKEFDD